MEEFKQTVQEGIKNEKVKLLQENGIRSSGEGSKKMVFCS